MNHVYHFCAMYQKEIGVMSYYSGVATVNYKILCDDTYQKTLRAIKAKSSESAVITSLTYLGGKE